MRRREGERGDEEVGGEDRRRERREREGGVRTEFVNEAKSGIGGKGKKGAEKEVVGEKRHRVNG